MTKKTIEYLKPEEIAYAVLPEEDNKVITETAGFVPLEVKLKRFEQNGMIAQFNESEFTSSDLRTMYLNPEFDITPEDDMEEAMAKVQAQQEFILAYRNKLQTSDISVGNSEVAPQAVNTDDIQKNKDVNKSESAVDKA